MLVSTTFQVHMFHSTLHKLMLKVPQALDQAEEPSQEQNPFRKDELSSHTPVLGRRIGLTLAIDVD